MVVKRAHYDSATPYMASHVMLRKGNKVLFVLRSHTGWMNGYYALPAGKVEAGETYATCAIRETKEEVGVSIDPKDLEFVLTVQRKGKDSDWVDMFFQATKWKGTPVNGEPDKHSAIAWLDLDNLPANVVPPFLAALKHIKAGKMYSEYGWRKGELV